MDFASLIDLKTRDLIDWDNYPIQSGKWYDTRGMLEPIVKREKTVFPLADARIFVILHENHRVYFSLPQNKEYTPFILEPALQSDIRKYVQDFFRETYHLELSVRPVSKKWISLSGEPFIMVNAQIQTGDNSDFSSFGKEAYQEWRQILDT